MKYVSNVLLLLLWTNASFAQPFQDPQPYGGHRGAKMLIEQEMNFPETALNAKVKGTVNLKFIINADGTMRDLQVWQPLHPELDEEAMRLCSMIRWRPALVGGLPRSAEHYLRIQFDPKKYARIAKDRKPKSDLPLPVSTEMELYEAIQLDSLPIPIIDRGMKGLTAYLASEMKYPSEALKRNIQGTVLLEFVVESSGSVTNTEALESLGGGCSLEAQRLIRSIDWRPGMKDGMLVRSVMQVRMDFRLQVSR